MVVQFASPDSASAARQNGQRDMHGSDASNVGHHATRAQTGIGPKGRVETRTNGTDQKGMRRNETDRKAARRASDRSGGNARSGNRCGGAGNSRRWEGGAENRDWHATQRNGTGRERRWRKGLSALCPSGTEVVILRSSVRPSPSIKPPVCSSWRSCSCPDMRTDRKEQGILSSQYQTIVQDLRKRRKREHGRSASMVSTGVSIIRCCNTGPQQSIHHECYHRASISISTAYRSSSGHIEPASLISSSHIFGERPTYNPVYWPPWRAPGKGRGLAANAEAACWGPWQ